ncbi:hypothetical protein BJ138DRAFT_1120750 [Hygrophoropsis aurantiaca]|uniref:Uncharacterized protein n=1 Tax=Hygrophoropsis aurantiaca TaxID=72124 RepID=A0ACB7ZPS8_9AGAM|nr:hypothetical protein BJ138DRAFT_1120750 [Hygrophoropsis aurantiaca]
MSEYVNVPVCSCGQHAVQVTRVCFTKDQILKALDIVAELAWAESAKQEMKAEDTKVEEIKEEVGNQHVPQYAGGVNRTRLDETNAEPKWYSVTTGREVRVFSNNAQAHNYVNGVSGGLMTRFPTHAEAKTHFYNAIVEGRVRRVHDGTVTDYNLDNGGPLLQAMLNTDSVVLYAPII